MTTLVAERATNISPTSTSVPLVIADRCDRCNAQAFVRASRGRSELLFCGHHGRANTPSLIAGGFIVDDQTHRINEKPSPGANI